MLIIFDLDDTLVDTSACITPVMLEVALKTMMQNGLKLQDFAMELDTLKRLNFAAESSKSALEEFIEIQGYDPNFLYMGLKCLYGEFPADISIFQVEGAQDILEELARSHTLTLVTVGVESQQMMKMKKAGIDSSLFSKIVISEEKGKKNHYEAIIEEFEALPSRIVVCGDRIDRDLVPGKELGFRTIHFKWGRGLFSKGRVQDVDFTITHLMHIKEILTKLQNSSI